MDFYEVLAKIIDILQREGRTSYRALKRQFDLDDEYLKDLKAELIEVRELATDRDNKMLVWTGEAGSPKPNTKREVDEETQFYTVLQAVMSLLGQERRVTYRRLKYVFSLDNALLEEIQKELTFRQLARDERGEGLVWIGEPQPVTAPVVEAQSQSAATTVTSVPTLSPVTKPSMPSNGPTVPPEAISTDVPLDESIIQSEPTRTAPEAERRQLTVMFCDLADSTKLSQQLDPEDLREVIRAYQNSAAGVIQRYEGHIAQYLGDGLLVYFGWPRAHEDDAQRALHSGLGIVEAITTSLNPRLKQDKGVQLTVRLGIHTGPVVVGQMGSDGRQENLATGETVNIAARLEGLAQPNTVIISRVTERLVRGAFVLEELGSQVLKGVAEPMQVCRVLSPAETQRDEDENMPDGGVFLVGRDEEVGLLLRRWEQAKEGLGQVVLISGEAGIGKSSLVSTVRAHVRETGHTRITFQCSPYHTNSALYPVIAHLEQMLGFERDDSPDAKLDKLEQVLRTTSLPLEESVPLLATLLSIPLEDRYPALTLSPQQQRQQTLDTLVTWLMEESEKQPVLAVWDDLHWSDPSTLEMLGLMVDQSPTAAILNLLTFRPEFEPPWPSRSHMTPITLNRLEHPQVEALITHLTGDKALPTEVVEHIVTKTDGVPLYVEELTKMLLTSNLLQEEAGQYVLTGPLSTVAIPDTLQDSLMARLDQMNTAKEVAQLGAVVGREFAYEMIQAISPQDKATLQEGLAQLVEAELLYQRGRPPRARYVFKHALIQDAAYASLLRSQRQHVHQQIAQVLEAQFPETTENQPELLAYHCTEASLNEKAIEYWHEAGQQAVERSAYKEAVAHLTKGLKVLADLPDTPLRTEYELALHVALGSPLQMTKGYGSPDVERVYNRARALCQQVGETPRLLQVLLGLRTFYQVQGAFQTAREVAEQSVTLAQRLQDVPLLSHAHQALGHTVFSLGEFRQARKHFEQGIACYDREQHRSYALSLARDPGVFNLCNLAWSLWYLGCTEQALARIQDALVLAQDLSYPASLEHAFSSAAVTHQLRRESAAVQTCVDAALAISQEHSFTMRFALGTILRGWALTQQGQLHEGIPLMTQGMADFQATGAEGWRHYWSTLLAEVYSITGQYEEGLMSLAEALALVEQNGECFYAAEAHRLKGELLLQSSADNHTDAETCFHQAIAIAQSQSAKSWELRAATSLAKLWQSQDKFKDAYELLEPVYGWFTEGFDTADLKDANALLGELA